MALPHPDWIATTISVRGPAQDVAALRAAAAGPGVVPWLTDYDRAEEDWFLLLMREPPSGRTVTARAARLLARQIREAAELREAAIPHHGRTCPFDLHQLAPVPAAILRLGAAAPEARRWMWQNWGTTWYLRRVAEMDPAGAGWRLWIVSADWTPWPIIAAIRARWPALTIDTRSPQEMPA